ncbi:Aste57867_23991 [Aphanomyces stellatus]|uniref:Aste57867_23991 protein n=1 Tax=Aphanomyces stellatus TaxID=120398 RepID=A0A485LTK7_9STRA|nr:hypothetical protein As57867_023918 [Aphanomyces stellatus]VFU00634.1 Aste57867_23991 [Aphanomyces stellatus]
MTTPGSARRDSVNRAAGTYETKPITVTKDVYREFLTDKVKRLNHQTHPIPTYWTLAFLRRFNLYNIGTCAFETYPFERLNHTFLTLQSSLVEILKLFGDNTYKIPHLAKEKQARLGRLPGNLECPHDVFAAAVDKLERLDGANLDRVFAEELEAAQQVDELARVLEGVALNDDETDDGFE